MFTQTTICRVGGDLWNDTVGNKVDELVDLLLRWQLACLQGGHDRGSFFHIGGVGDGEMRKVMGIFM